MKFDLHTIELEPAASRFEPEAVTSIHTDRGCTEPATG